MTDRPTPEEIGRVIDFTPGVDEPVALFMHELDKRGYVIVHPFWSTCPRVRFRGNEDSSIYDEGWNDCRARIFAAAEQEQTDD